MAKRISLILLLVAAFMSSRVTAQTSQVLYYMNLPQRNTLNPALQSSGRTFVGIPAISDIYVRFDNNFLNLTDVYRDGVISDSTVTFLEPCEELDRFLAELQAKNSFEPQAGLMLLGVGFTVGNDLKITFDITDRVDGNFVLPEDLVRLGIRGNEDYIGRSIDLTAMRSDVRYYHETGIGASKNITGKLRIGGRIMFLSGVAAGYFDNNSMSIKVNDDYTQTVNADVALRVSGPVSFYKDANGIVDSVAVHEDVFEDAGSIMSYLAGTGNPGLGIELGAEYKFNEMFTVSGALTDLGFIRWKRDRSDLVINEKFELNGLTMQDVYDGTLTFDELMNWTLDSIQNAMELVTSANPFTTYLPFGITAGFSYSPVKYFTAGVLSQTRFKGKQVHESLTLSGNFNLGNTFSGTLAYTMANHRFDNIGIGLSVRGSVFQFYALIDNLVLNWTKMKSGGGTISLPANWYTVHARLGLNLVFGSRVNEKPLPPM